MAFDTVRVRKVRKDDEDSFLDWDGRATLFDDEGEPEEAQAASLDDEVDDEDGDGDEEAGAGDEEIDEVGDPDEE